MLRRFLVAGLAALVLWSSTASDAFARGRSGGGGGGGGGRGWSGGGRGWSGGGWNGDHHNNNWNWGSFAAGAVLGSGLGYGWGGYGGYGSSYPYYGYSSYYYPDSSYSYPSNYYSTPAYSAPDYGYATTTAPSAPMNNNMAILNIHVPASARIFFDSTEMTQAQSGEMRQFQTPPLARGSDYQYQLRAQWTVNGQLVDRVRTVTVHAGDVVNVDFMTGS
jgi:uncharacterized protein (TIGR03000 family)